MRKFSALFLAVLLCMNLCACGGSKAVDTAEVPTEPTYSPEELAYNDAMTAYFKTVDPAQIAGDKAVVCIHDPEDYEKCIYTTRYLPGELMAESPGEVRYVIHCYENVTEIGWYTSGGKAYRYSLNAKLDDLKYDVPIAIDTESVARIQGSEPPKEVSEAGDHYGSRPAFEELGAAVTEAVMGKIAEYETWLSAKLCANCGIQLKDQYVCCPECGTFR